LRQQLELFGRFRYHCGLKFQGYPVFSSGRTPSRPIFSKLILVALMTVGSVIGGTVWAREALAESGPALLPASALPQEARQTLVLIHSGGPFPYSKDGIVFGNRESLLPRKTRGYYHEYTVPTPGSHDRGARRIVCGGAQSKAPETCYYSADHYASFRGIAK
jgi:ribonuclease T1